MLSHSQPLGAEPSMLRQSEALVSESESSFAWNSDMNEIVHFYAD